MSSAVSSRSDDGRTAGLSIGEAAERTGLSVHALRFYEREGLFPKPIRRDEAGRRVFGADDLEWLEICAGLRASGMPLPAIRRYAELIAQGPGNERERLAILREHEERVTAQMRALEQALAAIRWKVGVYHSRVTRGTADQLWNPLSTPRRGTPA